MYESEGSSAEFCRLLRAAAAGGRDKRDELLEAAAHRLRVITRATLRDFPRIRRWEETDDVYQNALIRLCRSLEEVAPKTRRDFFGLAMTQIRRTLLDLVRHYYGPEGQGTNHHSDTGSQLVIATAKDVSTPPDSELSWVRFHEAVESLPEEECEAFSLVWYGGVSQTDAAEMLEISRRTMTRRMTRARLQIHAKMGGEMPHREGDA